MSEIWKAAEVAQAVGGELAVDAGTPVTGVSIDSRSLKPAELFVAIKGDRLDGHYYVEPALGAGASLAIVENGFTGDDKRLIRVPDPLRAMEVLGSAARARFGGRTIAVTGSVGKTGTKEALRLALSPSGTVHASQKSYNNHWGVPLTLSNLPKDAAFGVFEIGMNHPGEITPLTEMVRPDIAIVTTVEPVHLGFFSSVEEIAEAKAEIFRGLAEGGVAVLNRDNPHYALLTARAKAVGARIVSFGDADDADVRLVSLALHTDHSEVGADLAGTAIRYRVGAPGRHLIMNSLAVLAAAHLAGADVAKAAAAMAEMRAPQGRGAQIVLGAGEGRITLVDESYNANPASMRAAIAVLGQSAQGRGVRTVAVLGDMLELGDMSDTLHQDLSKPIDEAAIDVVLACGKHMRALWESLPRSRRGAYAETAEALKPALLETVRGGDVVMIKGSLGSRMGPLVEAVKRRFAGKDAGQG